MSQNFTPALLTTDWNEEWKKLQKARRRTDDSAFWDERSKTFTTKDAPNAYVDSFIGLMGIQPGETVFDMGCGTGSLSVPLGMRGHRVMAADFSRGMLAVLEDNLAESGVTTVTPKLMSWSDNWEAHGISENSADIAIASRSIVTSDLADSLLRLDRVARRRACITLAIGAGPRTDERVLSALGIDSGFGNDHLYAFTILANKELRPEMSYIDSVRADTFDSFDDAFGGFARMVDDALASTGAGGAGKREEAREDLAAWLGEHLEKNPEAGTPDRKGLPQKALRLDQPRTITWAFIAWNTQRP